MGNYFQSELVKLAAKHSVVIDVRGKGLMLAIEVNSPELGKLAVAEMLKRRIVINCTSETVLRFLPPYILEKQHVDQAVAALDEIFSQQAAQNSEAAAGGTNRG